MATVAPGPTSSMPDTEIQLGDLILPALIAGRYVPRAELGRGGAGIVIAVTQKNPDMPDLEIQRALKLLNPRGIASDPDRMRAFEKTFDQEISLLASITHRNVVKIVDAGRATFWFVDEGTGRRSKCVRPYIVLELVEPPANCTEPLTLETCVDWLKPRYEGRKRLRPVLLDLLIQVVEGLDYIHSNGIEHFDLKPSNILCAVQHDLSLEARIGDLGVAKLIPTQATAGKLTTIHGTEIFAPRYGWRYVNKNEPVSDDLLHRWRRNWDLFCLGMTFASFLSSTPPHREEERVDTLLSNIRPIYREVFEDADLTMLTLIIRKLTARDTEDDLARQEPTYDTVAQVKEDLCKLQDSYLQPLRIPDFAIGGLTKSVNLATGRLPLSDRENGLISHRVFERLALLSQLNFVHKSFPDAHHTRLSHSLRVLQMAKFYVQALLRDPYFKFLMDASAYSLLFASTLLHDIGHYPLAHAIEDLRREGLPVQSHRTLVRYMLQPGATGSLAAILQSPAWRVDIDALVRVVGDESPQSDSEWLCRSIIDGPIDVDKVAYLRQDSSTTGVAYGLGVDLDALLGGLIVIPELGGAPCQIGIELKAISAVTSIVAARFKMYERVYWNHTNRAVMAMIKHVMRTLLTAGEMTFEQYMTDTFYRTDVEALRYLADKYDGKELRVQGNPLRGILDGRREIYKRLFRPRAIKQDKEVHEYLLDLTPMEEDELRKTVIDVVETVGQIKLEEISDVVFDIPRTEPERDVRSVQVRLAAENYDDLNNLSDVVKAYHTAFKTFVKIPRIFISPSVHLALQQRHRVGTVTEAVERTIRDCSRQHHLR